jgi:signal transduction histidine kinase
LGPVTADRVSESSVRAQSGLQVLLVEDNPDERFILTQILQSRGHEVVACVDGETAIEAFLEAPFQLLLLDLMLPGIDGLELCRRIRSGPRGEIPVILVVTARDEADVLEAVLHAGANDFVAKPIHIEGLRVRIAIAEREVEVQAERRAFREGLQATAQELEVFAYSVSHDLRTPLRTMTGFAHALLDEDLSERGRDFADRIISAGHRAEDLITDLLAYSRLSFTELELQPVDLNEVVRGVRGNLQADIESTGAVIAVAGSLPTVPAVSTVLQAVLQNLVSNAIKFVREGEHPQVRIVPALASEMLRVYVIDNGIGIPPGQEDRIFGVFERLPDQASVPGTGIGLAIVRRGMERLGGTAGVERRDGGSAFWIEIPTAPRPEAGGG